MMVPTRYDWIYELYIKEFILKSKPNKKIKTLKVE